MSTHLDHPGQTHYLVEVRTIETIPFVVTANSEAEAREQVLNGKVEPGDSSFSEPELLSSVRLGA